MKIKEKNKYNDNNEWRINDNLGIFNNKEYNIIL